MKSEIARYAPGKRDKIAALLEGDAFVRADVLRCLDEAPDCGFMLTDGDVFGVGAYTGNTPMTSMTLFVTQKKRRQGYGSRLLLAMLGAMRAGSVQTAVCDFSEDAGIRAFLERNGFARWFVSCYLTAATVPGDVAPGIRQYCDRDFDAAWALTQAAFCRMRLETGLISEAEAQAAAGLLPSPDERRAYMKGAGDRFVLTENGEPVGMLVLDGGEIDVLAVRPDRQGRGHGRALAQFALSELYRRGFEQCCLWCVEGNPARKLYESLGFSAARRHEFVRIRL